MVVFDADRAPVTLPGSLGLLEVTFCLLLLAGIWATWPPLAIALVFALLFWWIRSR